jgi:hypothetical protein
MIDFHEALGTFGSGLIILMYLMLQTGRLRSGSRIYLLSNLIGSALILYSLSVDWNLSAAIIQMFFIAISVYGLAFNHDR